jgi:hypothetical protein
LRVEEEKSSIKSLPPEIPAGVIPGQRSASSTFQRNRIPVFLRMRLMLELLKGKTVIFSFPDRDGLYHNLLQNPTVYDRKISFEIPSGL